MAAPRKTEFAAAVWALYRTGMSSYDVGARMGISGESVCSLLKRHGYPRRPRPRALAVVTYKGERFSPDLYGYLRSTAAATRAKGGHNRYLHRIVWEEHHGPIPAGHVVRMKDGNRANVAIENLECLPVGEVQSRYGNGTNGFTKGFLPNEYPEKTCPQCRKSFGPHLSRRHPEGAAAFIKRRFCGIACSRVWRKGRSRHASIAKTTWRQGARVAPAAASIRERTVAAIKASKKRRRTRRSEVAA